MTLKVDGTNGILQAYDYQVLTTGFSYTFASGTQTLIANPAGTLATGTITMPAAPADGMVITVQSTQQVTALTVAGNTGQSLVGAAVQLIPNQPLSYVYRSSNTTWYPFAGGAARASALVSATSVTTTSGTAVDFTSVPAWVKRITVAVNGVSTSGASHVQVQLGSGSVTTTGYKWSGAYCYSSTGGATATTGFDLDIGASGNATYVREGLLTLVNMGSNAWVASYSGGNELGLFQGAGGSITLGGTLDRVRLTTVNGTDTFDAGSVNILFE